VTRAELLAACQRGDRDAFCALVERDQRMVEAVAFAATRDRGLVDDIVQDTFVAAWQHLHRLRDPARWTPWLCGIARNVASKARRRRRREAEMVDVADPATPFDTAVDRERDAQLGTALAHLPARYREPLVLFYYQQCSVREVAQALAIREDAVMQRLSRARRQLGEELAHTVEDDLGRRRSRSGLVAWVLVALAALPRREAAAAPAAKLLGWRWFAGAAVVGGLALGMTKAVERSAAVAATNAATEASAPAAPRQPARSAPPRLAPDNQVHRVETVASLDPVETCASAAHGLVMSVLAPDSFRRVGNDIYYEPPEDAVRTANRIAAQVGPTCVEYPWPELYVVCEGTVAQILAGEIACYPYSELTI
jgi:RNA polymerase sigma-70 factor (ECF subfamily)